MSSITADYIITNCQDRAKYRRSDDDKITGFAMSSAEEIPDTDAETLKSEILIPQLSREGRKRIREVFSENQGIDVKFDYIKREDAEKKYLKPGEVFAVPKSKKLARITITGLPFNFYSPDILADIDTIAGLPNYKAEKPSYKPPTKD
jgi:hypothetical protein